jgi:hypothetical protein
MSSKSAQHTCPITTLREQGSNFNLPNNTVHAEYDIVFLVVENGNEHAVSDVRTVIFDCDFTRCSDGEKKCREDCIASQLEKMA